MALYWIVLILLYCGKFALFVDIYLCINTHCSLTDFLYHEQRASLFLTKTL